MKTKEEWTKVYHRHCQTVWNICYPYFMNPADTEDAVQETFLRLIRSGKAFRDEEHEKAWLIVTAKNVCRDEMKRARRKDVPLEEASALRSPETPEDETLLAIRELPEKQRLVIYLYYYEGYGTVKISQMLQRPQASVRSDLRRGRMALKKRLGGI
ncbi:MAG: sigma-70 family RNA polymerase sigma factor [Ruminococcaceae bacterium]|nr:sigma-70 family RNA polymerase sigma factor [Oscillospiraceae bacterium]